MPQSDYPILGLEKNKLRIDFLLPSNFNEFRHYDARSLNHNPSPFPKVQKSELQQDETARYRYIKS